MIRVCVCVFFSCVQKLIPISLKKKGALLTIQLLHKYIFGVSEKMIGCSVLYYVLQDCNLWAKQNILLKLLSLVLNHQLIAI